MICRTIILRLINQQPVRYRNGKKVDNVQYSDWKEFKQCMFPSSFPRRLDNRFAHSTAFDGKQLKNWEAINYAWESIRKDAERFIGLALTDEPPSAKCSHCEQQLPQYASELCDENKKPLLEGSDGYSHLLYLIMEIRKHPWPTVFLIEEPDVFMHPGLQRNFLKYLLYVSKRAKHQFFISTHSPYLLDFALRSEQNDSPPHVYRIFKENGESCLKFMNPADRSEAWETLRELGHSPADVLHPNGIIWVEGPSDKIYLQTWLNCFAKENGKAIKWAVDCDIVWYGGSNLAHLDAGFWKKAEANDIERLLGLLKISLQAAILVDRDELVGCETLSHDHMAKHKCRVMKQCEEAGILFWMTEGRTIEDYILDSAKTESGFTKDSKVNNAKKYQKWAEANTEKAYDRIIPPHSHLETQIRLLYDRIIAWRGSPSG